MFQKIKLSNNQIKLLYNDRIKKYKGNEMSKVLVLLADGFEEIEAFSVVDILRRANILVFTAAFNENGFASGAHNICVKTDVTMDGINKDCYDMLVLPGGLPGSLTLKKDKRVQKLIKDFDLQNKYIAAICAAPWALDEAGVLKEAFTCYPGCEKEMNSSGYTHEKNVLVDKNIITSRGPSTAMEFALELVKILRGKDKYEEIKTELLY